MRRHAEAVAHASGPYVEGIIEAIAMRNGIVQGLTPIVCGLALLLGVMIVGRVARASLLYRASYCLPFSDIDCQPPEGMSREVFLSEVRSLTSQPKALQLLDEELTSRLHRSFLAHPWVESVHRVAIDSTRTDSRHVRKSLLVEMVYRKAVLAVPLSPEYAHGKPESENGWCVVDRHGVLLPVTADRSNLPVLVAEVAAPAGPPGSRWGDLWVTAAAQTATFLQANLPRLHLENSQMEIVEGEFVICRPGVRIVWGHAPGQEKEDEAPAIVKLRRLLDYQKEHDGLESLEHDVRLQAYVGHFPLSADEVPHAVSLYESSQLPSRRNRDQVSNSTRSWRSCFNEAKPPSASASSR